MTDSASRRAFVRPGFHWDAADAYLFDIDGTLLNSRDAVHYFSFRHAVKEILGIDASIDGVPVHGNTDVGILRAALQQSNIKSEVIDSSMPKIISAMCAEVQRNQEQLRPELCPSIVEVISYLEKRGKLLGAASGNLETIGWLKLEKAGLKRKFAFGSFSFPRESRADIFQHGVVLARKRLGEHATVTVVGDTPSDVQAARAIDVPVITLATGIFSFDELKACDPDACFGCAADLLALSA
jgi:phosphoglycolate phosphatase